MKSEWLSRKELSLDEEYESYGALEKHTKTGIEPSNEPDMNYLADSLLHKLTYSNYIGKKF